MYSVSNDSESRQKVLTSIVNIFLQTQEIAKECAKEEGRLINPTPAQFLLVFHTYKKLLKERQMVVQAI